MEKRIFLLVLTFTLILGYNYSRTRTSSTMEALEHCDSLEIDWVPRWAYQRLCDGISCLSTRPGGLVITTECLSCNIVGNSCSLVRRCDRTKRHKAGLSFKNGYFYYHCHTDLCNYAIPLRTNRRNKYFLTRSGSS